MAISRKKLFDQIKSYLYFLIAKLIKILIHSLDVLRYMIEIAKGKLQNYHGMVGRGKVQS